MKHFFFHLSIVICPLTILQYQPNTSSLSQPNFVFVIKMKNEILGTVSANRLLLLFPRLYPFNIVSGSFSILFFSRQKFNISYYRMSYLRLQSTQKFRATYACCFLKRRPKIAGNCSGSNIKH